MPCQKQSGPSPERASTKPTPGLRESFSASPGNRCSSAVGVERRRGVQHVEEGVGAGRDHPDAVLLVRFRLAAPQEVLVEIVEEVLEESRRSPPAGADPAHQPEPRPDLGLRRPRRIQELVEDPPLEPLAAGEIPVGRARRLAVVGQDVEIVPVLGHAAQHAPELADRAVHATQRPERPPAPGTEGVRRDVVVEVVHVHGRSPGVEIAATLPA